MTEQGGARPRPHLLGHEIADYLDGELDARAAADAAAHAAACPVCASTIAAAAPDGAVPDAPGPADAGAFPAAALPEPFHRALAERSADDPRPGQLWRLRADDPWEPGEVAALGVVVAVEPEILVAPATSDDPTTTDLWTASLPVAGTGAEVAVWAALAAPVGPETLDVLLGAVDPDAVQLLHRALRRGSEPPRGMRLGRVPDAGLSEYREQLRGRFAKLSECRLLARADGADEGAGIGLADAMAAAGWRTRDLKVATGLTASQARDAAEGRLALTPGQAASVERALGVALAAQADRPPAAWVRAVSAPRRRSRFESVACATGQDPWRLRADQARAPRAARTAAGTETDWEALAEQQLRELEAAAGLEG